MITPFTEDNKVDYKAVERLTNWFIDRGSRHLRRLSVKRMFFLTKEELSLARAVVDAAAGRIKVIASGHTADDHSQQIDELGAMAETGVDAVVLVSNRLAKADEGADVFNRNAEDIFNQLSDVTFGLYECPYPPPAPGRRVPPLGGKNSSSSRTSPAPLRSSGGASSW